MAAGRIRKVSKMKTNISSTGAEFILQVSYFLCSVVVAKGAVLANGRLSPFGASLAASVPSKYLFSSAMGSAVGYILLDPSESFRYLAMMAAIGTIRWLLKDLKRISKSLLYAPVVAFSSVLITGIALLFSKTGYVSDFMDCLVESLAAGGAAFFIQQAISLFLSHRPLTSFNQQEIASIVIAGCILILSFNVLNIGKVSLGRIIAVLMILMCARYGGAGIGSISGISTGIVFSLSNLSFNFLCVGYAFGGMISGVFSPLGKAAAAAAFALCNMIMVFPFAPDDPELYICILIETTVSVTAFMLMPKTAGYMLSAVLSPNEDKSKGEALKHSVITRLGYVSDALANVSGCVNQVSGKIKKLYSPTIEWVYSQTAEKICSQCGLRVLCWEKQKEISKDDFNRLTETLKNAGNVSEKTINELFVKKCCKSAEIAKSVNDRYIEYLLYEQAQRRVDQVRAVVAGQFSGLGEILRDLSNEFNGYRVYDTDCSENVSAKLKELGFSVVMCSCMLNRNGRMVLEIEVVNKKSHLANLRKAPFRHEISKVCSRKFDTPCITCAGNNIRVTMSEQAAYDIRIGTSQHVSHDGELCGDHLNHFSNGFGSVICLISDGMGTGGRAAVDSNMAVGIMTRLCKSGLSYDSALKIVNSALMVKAEKESLATLDAVSVDLFSGQALLMKAGAPITFLKKNGKLIKKELPALPLGILHSVEFSKWQIQLSAGDIIVMVSDGAMLSSDKWLESLIKTWKDGDMGDLASSIVNEASRRRSGEHDDDITAMAIQLIEN